MGEKISYGQFEGYAASSPSSSGTQKKPVVLVAHAWRGCDDFAKNKAEQLAELGYLGFAIDMYGKGIVVTNEEAPSMMMPLFVDRAELRKRVLAALETIKKHPQADTTRIGAIGFCFGGLVVLELARSNVGVNGVVSFHGLLGDTCSGNKAKLEKTNGPLHTKILVQHGHLDPMVSQNDIANFEKEMDNAQADWQMIVYGQAMHAFTNPIAQSSDQGMLYNAIAEKRSWIAMKNFFQEIFGG